ncbi:MAG TPA: patatin-like phospholipase family protein [Verrucomicrobiae bacterium]|jgi:NTE family protein
MNGQAKILNPNQEHRGGELQSHQAQWPHPHLDPASKVVTLASLSRSICEETLPARLAQALGALNGRAVLLVQLVESAALLTLGACAQKLPTINGEFGFTEHLEKGADGYSSLTLRVTGGADELACLGGVVMHLRQHFGHVLLNVGRALAAPVLMECASHSDLTYLFLGRNLDEVYHLNQFLHDIRARSTVNSARIKAILCAGEEENTQEFRDLITQIDRPHESLAYGHSSRTIYHSLLYWNDRKGDFAYDVRRLAREIAGCRIGLALSSGGAKGLAHIGVIQVLEENGIEVDVVAGCSMGAYVGSIWAYGHDGLQLEALARELERRWGLLHLIDPVIPPRQGFLRAARIKARLKRSIGDAHFCDLMRPLRIVATNLDTLERGIFSSGEIATAVHASIAIPGVCIPVIIDGEPYVDGGTADPLPTDVLDEMGIEHIIAVNTIPTPGYLRCSREAEREQAERAGKGAEKIKMMSQHFNYLERGNILDILLRSSHGSQMRVAEQACRYADVVIRPLTCDTKWHDFTHPGKYIALGRRVAEERLDELKALVAGKKKPHETDPTNDTMAGLA